MKRIRNWDVKILFWLAALISAGLSLLYPALSAKWFACTAVTLSALIALDKVEK